jgi:hypothetical protein
MDRTVKLDPSEAGQVACTSCASVFQAGDNVVLRDSETPSGQEPYCPACAKEKPMNANMKFKADFDLTPADGRLQHLGDLGYLTIDDVEDPGGSAPGGMNVQDWVVYRANWLAVSKALPEGGVEGQGEFLKEHPGEEYPGDVVHEDGFINVYKGSASVVEKAKEIVSSLSDYPLLDDDTHSELENEALEDELDSWAMREAEEQLGYRKGWEDALTDEEAAWMEGLRETNPDALARIEKGAEAIYNPSGDDERKLRMAVRDGLTYGDWTVVHIDPVIEALEQEGAGYLADPAATLHQFLAKEKQAGEPGSAADMKEKEAAGQQRLFESLRLVRNVVAGKREIKRLVAAGDSVTKAKSVANMVAKIIGVEPSISAGDGGLITYKVRRQLMAALFKAHGDGSFGVSWAPMRLFADVEMAGKVLSAHTMLSFDATTKLRALGDAIIKFKAAGSRWGVWNAYDEIPAYPEAFATEAEAMAAAQRLKERVKAQGFWKASDGNKVPYDAITVATHAENPDAGLLVVPESDNPEMFAELWGGEGEVEELQAGKKCPRLYARVKAKGGAGNSDDIGPASLKARIWARLQGYQVHAGADVLCDASRSRFKLWAKTPKGFEPVVKELKHQKGVANPWAVAWSMKNKGIKPKAAKVAAGIEDDRPEEEQVRSKYEAMSVESLASMHQQNDPNGIFEEVLKDIKSGEDLHGMGTTPEEALAEEKKLLVDIAMDHWREDQEYKQSKVKASANSVVFDYGVDEEPGSGRGDRKSRYIYLYTDEHIGAKATAEFKSLESDKVEWDGNNMTPGFRVRISKDSYDTLYAMVTLLERKFGADNVKLDESGVGTEGSITIKLAKDEAEPAEEPAS